VPQGPQRRARANVAALTVLRQLEAEGRAATADEQQALAAWSGWGAVPQVFDDDHAGTAELREELRSLLDDDGWDAARPTVLNAHYTDPAGVVPMWEVVARLGFTGGRVLEPGCGSGYFLAYAPPGAALAGVERDPTTAAIARALYPDPGRVNGRPSAGRAPSGLAGDDVG
jgi:SAM-dependent methyltransferase